MSDSISTNTVFHFTKSMDNLESILKNDFYPHYCFEDFFGTISSIPNVEKAIPMVCFCDIPLSQVQKHIKTYGEYALGLSKKWAIKKKINPVLYAYPNSDFTNKLNDALFELVQHEKDKDLSEKLSDQFISAIQYIKPYEGKLWKDGQWTKDMIRFYDEREWRYIPQLAKSKSSLMIRKRDSLEDKDYPMILKKLNDLMATVEHLRLSFEPNDIKFIIVRNENEVLPMLDNVINIKREKFPYKDVQILTTRIISMDSIKENF